jgi:competence protein ComEC
MLAAALAAAALAAIRAPTVGLLAAALLIGGALLGGARLAQIDAPSAAIGEGLSVDASAILLERPRPTTFGTQAEIELVTGDAAGAKVLARADGELEWPSDLAPGVELDVAGYASPPETRPGSDFDWARFLAGRGVVAELDLEAVEATGGRRGGLAGVLDRMRLRAEEALGQGLEPDDAALARGMVIGQDQEIDELVRDDFRRAGLAHILAVSGQNVMLLGLLALPALAALRLGPRARLAALLVLIALYVPLAGAGPSLQRAAAMGAAGIAAMMLGRPASRWYGMLIAAAATLAINPRLVSDVGWQLSFAAVAGIMVLGPRLRASLSELPRPIAEAIALTVAATLATAPLLAHHFGTISVASLPANLLALPAVAPAMWIGMVQIALGQFAVLGEPFASLASAVSGALGAVNGLLLTYIAEVARRLAELPGAEVGVELRSPLAVAAAYAGLGAGALATRRLARRTEPRAQALASRWRTAPRRRRVAAVLVALLLLAALGRELSAPGEAPDRLTVSFLDVGQGDATLIQHPDGSAVLFDGGPEEARVARPLHEAGVTRLSAVVATHASADHQGGLVEVLERFPVELLVDGGDGTTDPGFEAVLGAARSRGVPVVPGVEGRRLRLGGMAIDILSPEPRPPGPAPEDPNPRAVVAVVSSGRFELLLSGDAESPSLLPLELPDVDAIKVPHHGSSDTGLAAALAELQPEIAAIEVGENTYGHPHPDTLAALHEAGVDVYRTDEDGTVELSVVGGRMAVATER